MAGLRRIACIALLALISAVSVLVANESLIMPVVPDSLRIPSDRADYIALHFWDSFDFGNDQRATDRGFLEQAFVDFIDLLGLTRPEVAEVASEILLKRASEGGEAVSIIMDLSQKYLVDAESPMWSEELSVPYMRYAVSRNPDDQLSAALLSDAMKFRSGMPAEDFGFYLSSDRSEKRRLADLIGKEILLVFMDPHCQRCEEFVSQLSSDKMLSKRVEEGQTYVLIVEVGAENSGFSVPPGWLKAFPASGKDDPADIYSLRVLPGRFLIGADGEIVLKDFTPQGLMISLASGKKN